MQFLATPNCFTSLSEKLVSIYCRNGYLVVNAPVQQSLIRSMTNSTRWQARQAKTQISLAIRTVWGEFSLSDWRGMASLASREAHNEDADQTECMHRLILVFAGRTGHYVGFAVLRFSYCEHQRNGCCFLGLQVNVLRHATLRIQSTFVIPTFLPW